MRGKRRQEHHARCWSATSDARSRGGDPPGSCRAAASGRSGPTKVSKNRQVRRATCRRRARSSRSSLTVAERASGRARARPRARAPRATSSGSATAATRAAGGDRPDDASAKAPARSTSLATRATAPVALAKNAAVCAADVHWSRRRRVTNRRTSVRPMASSAHDGVVRQEQQQEEPAPSLVCHAGPQGRIALRRRPRANPVTRSVKMWPAGASTPSAVHTAGCPGSTSQPATQHHDERGRAAGFGAGCRGSSSDRSTTDGCETRPAAHRARAARATAGAASRRAPSGAGVG